MTMTNAQSTSGPGQESMDSSNAQDSLPTAPQKTRVSLACKRCKRRKQRCDGARPRCKSCNKAGVGCTYEKAVRPQYPGGKSLYINALEERIAFLESRLPDHAQDHMVSDLQAQPDTSHGQCQNAPEGDENEQYRSPHSSPIDQMSDDTDFVERTSLVGGVAYLSLCASGTTDSQSEPYYVGSSSGSMIARIIQASIFGHSKSRTVNEAAASTDQEERPGSITPPQTVQSDEIPLGFPEIQQARMLFDTFFERIHSRWPILDRIVYEDLFAKQFTSGVLTVVERSIFHLIYAITARFLSLTKRLQTVDPEHHLIAATGPMSCIVEQHSLASLQFLVLLGVHGQRYPYGAGAWSQIRYATSICIEMGLHRKRPHPETEKQARDEELRRRIFWSCYGLDRATSIVLGRAFAIADRDINVELPSAASKFWTLTHKETRDPTQSAWSNVGPFIHIIKLDRIHSRIHKVVFRVDRDVLKGTAEEQAKRDRKMATIKADLDTWMESYPQTPKNGNKTTWMYDPESAYLDARDFYGVQYHKSILFLFTNFLPTLQTSDPRFHICTSSAASVCTAYKRLNQNKTLTYTMISLHSCFVAGLTLIYCIWRDRSLFSYEILEATRDCSQSLTIFGEKWPGAVKYRDVFDELSGNLLKTIVNPGPLRQPSLGSRQSLVTPENAFNVHTQAQQTQQAMQGHTVAPSDRPANVVNTPIISAAIREAFMEVDEEAPGGWQGWRMWNEMVSDNTSHVADLDPEYRLHGQTFAPASWEGYENVYDMDPVQDAIMHTGNYGAMGTGNWNYRT